jgi:signal transduction histidine kinase
MKAVAAPHPAHVPIPAPEIKLAPSSDAPMTAGDLAELLSTFNDVTARLHGTHEALQREVVRLRDELQKANEQLQRSRRLAALGEMAAGIAHEVRNPLGSIRLYARMLEDDLADRPEEQQIAGKIAAAVSGLDAVVGDVLAFARELRLRCDEHDGAELMTRALESAWNLEAGESGIRVVRRHEDACDLRCDGSLLHQALVNIIRNALEAMAEAKAPRTGHELRLECLAAGGESIFRISDTGPGISSEVLDRMFNPFFTTRATGTGLGLAIVHRIIDAHGGSVQVRDRASTGDGNGTVFEIILPRGRSKEKSVLPGVEAGRNGSKEAHR